jgi:hypothetical protein
MKNFYALDTPLYIDSKKYIDAWKKFVYPQEKYDLKQIQSISSHIKNLWSQFNNTDEKKLDKHYMNDFFFEYICFFLIPNIERTYSILSREENRTVFDSLLQEAVEKDIIVVDFGSGPLSASTGFLFAFDSFLNQNPHIKNTRKIKIWAIDRSERSIAGGRKLLEQSTTHVEVIQATSIEKVTDQINIVLCANVLNEIPEKHKHKTFQSIFNRLSQDGTLLILEPGQQEHSKKLSALRDSLLEQNKDQIQIIAPCAHKKECPLKSDLRKDWCWFKHYWDIPDFYEIFNKYTKIDHYFLNYSYLLTQKKPLSSVPPYFSRVVSDEMQVDLSIESPQQVYFKNNLINMNQKEFENILESQNQFKKVLLCTQDGNLESLLTQTDNALKRGQVTLDLPQSGIRIKERTC